MNRTATLVVSLLAGAAALSPAMYRPAMAGDLPGVRIVAPADVAADSDFTVSIDISDVTALDAGQFDVSFDKSQVQLEDVTAGRIGATEVPVDLWNEMGAGTCRIIVNVPGVPGVSGSGSLAVLHFHSAGSAAGGTSLVLSNGFLNSNLGTEITATWAGDSITVLNKPPPSGPMPESSDTEEPPGATAPAPVFRWWLLSAIIGGAVVLIAATAVGVLWRRSQLLRMRDR